LLLNLRVRFVLAVCIRVGDEVFDQFLQGEQRTHLGQVNVGDALARFHAGCIRFLFFAHLANLPLTASQSAKF